MKKQLLYLLFGAAVLNASAQLNSAGDGYILDNSDGNSNCYGNYAPSPAGAMSYGTSITSGGIFILNANGPYVLTSADPGDNYKSATWFAIPHRTGEGYSSTCSSLYEADLGIDMTNNSSVTLTAESSEVGAVLELYLGSDGQWYPATSTFWTGDTGIVVSHTFTSANSLETFTLDLDSANSTAWSNWSGKSKIQSMGFISNTPSATFKLYEIKFGAEADLDNSDIDTTWKNSQIPTNIALNQTYNANVYTSDAINSFDGVKGYGTDFWNPRNYTGWISVVFNDISSVDSITFEYQASPGNITTQEIYTTIDGTTWILAETISLSLNYTIFGTLNRDSVTYVFSSPLTAIKGIKVKTIRNSSWVAWSEIEIWGSSSCSDIIVNDTLTNFVSNKTFQSISPKTYFKQTDKLTRQVGGCDSTVNYYTSYVFNPNNCTTTVFDTITTNSQIPINGLIANYPFNGNANDESTNSHNGIIYGAILTEDRHGNLNSAFSFDGVNDYIALPTSSDWDFGNNDFSISSWFLQNDGSNGNIIRFDNGYGPGALWGVRVFNKKLEFLSGQGNQPFTDFEVAENNWHHSVTVRNGYNLKIYYDGNLVLDSIVSSITNITTQQNYYPSIGRLGSYNGEYFSGKIDDIKIYDKGLTQTEVSSLYHENKSANLVTDYDTTTITVTDTNYVTINNYVNIYDTNTVTVTDTNYIDNYIDVYDTTTTVLYHIDTTQVTVLDTNYINVNNYIDVYDSLIVDLTGVITAINAPFNNTLQVKIYPNPASDNLTLEVLDASVTESYLYQLFSVTGQNVVSNGFLDNEIKTIDLSSLNSGTYFVKFYDSQFTLLNTAPVVIKK